MVPILNTAYLWCYLDYKFVICLHFSCSLSITRLSILLQVECVDHMNRLLLVISLNSVTHHCAFFVTFLVNLSLFHTDLAPSSTLWFQSPAAMHCKEVHKPKKQYPSKLKPSKNEEKQPAKVIEQTKVRSLQLSDGHQQRYERVQSISPRGFLDLLEKILRAVFVGRPLHVDHFIADFLDAELARRTFNDIVYGCQLKKCTYKKLDKFQIINISSVCMLTA